MDENLKIRQTEKDNLSEIEQMINLHNANYKDNRTVDNWLWEYTFNYPDSFVFSVVEDRGKIVGTQGMIPIYLNIKGKSYLTGKSESTLLDKKYRGKNLFQRLYADALSVCRKKNMHCVWGYTTTTLARAGLRDKLDFVIFDNILFETKLILDAKILYSELKSSNISIVKKLSKRVLLSLRNMRSKSRLNKLSKVDKNVKFRIKKRPIGKNDVDKLFSNLRNKYPDLIYLVQDDRYVNWRIYENPNLDYKTIFIYEKNRLRGYCYYLIRSNRAFLVDITFDEPESGKFLLSHLVEKFKSEKVGLISYMGNVENPVIEDIFGLLSEYGFIKNKTTTSEAFVLKNISIEDKSHLQDIKNWYLTRLWTEGYNY